MNAAGSYNEKILLSRVAQGDESAFGILFNQYRNKILFFGWKFLQSETRAEDLLQEVFLKVWLNRESLPTINNFKSWLSAITRNHIFNSMRRLAVEEAFLKEASARQSPIEQNTVLEQISFNELQNALQQAVSHLTPQQKKIFELSRLEGLKHEQIAEKLEISRDTVKKHMTDALRKIRLQLKSHEELVPLSILLMLIKL